MKYYRKLLIVTIGTIILMQGCNSHSAPNLPKSWQPMNQLSDQITEIPLIRPHFYQVNQLDTTVKGLLERWGEEAKVSVIYDHSSDFTLYKKVKNIRNVDLQAALSELTELYSDKNMTFYLQNNVIMAHKKIGVLTKTTAVNEKIKKVERNH